MEALMNKFIMMIEDLWVAVAFAEAGEYFSLEKYGERPLSREADRLHAA
jgi:hypothetical protein